MANTTKLTDRIVKITGLNANWTTPGDMPGMQPAGLRIAAIAFQGAASDICIIKAGKSSQKTAAAAVATTSTAGQIINTSISKGSFRREFNPPLNAWPFFVIADWTLASAANNIVTMELA